MTVGGGRPRASLGDVGAVVTKVRIAHLGALVGAAGFPPNFTRVDPVATDQRRLPGEALLAALRENA